MPTTKKSSSASKTTIKTTKTTTAIQGAAINVEADGVGVYNPWQEDLRHMVSEVKKKAFKTRKVIITYNDARDNNQTTTAYLTCENQYFALSKVVPLGVTVELEQCLIDAAKQATFLMHRQDGNGNSIPVPNMKKYNVSYED